VKELRVVVVATKFCLSIFTARRYAVTASAVYAVVVYLSVCYKSEFYQNTSA